MKKTKGIFSSIEEIEQALENKSISLHSKISQRLRLLALKENPLLKNTSTAGRFLLANLLPKNSNINLVW